MEIFFILFIGNKNVLLIESKILEFIYIYLEYLYVLVEEFFVFLLSDYYIQCLYDVKVVLKNSYNNLFGIEGLFKKVGINSNQLKLGFKYFFGIIVWQFVIDLWLYQVRQLIFDILFFLGYICQCIGYINYGYFLKL